MRILKNNWFQLLFTENHGSMDRILRQTTEWRVALCNSKYFAISARARISATEEDTASCDRVQNKLSRRPRLRCHRELISPRKNACVRQDAHLVAAQTPPPPPRSRRCVMNGFFCKRQSAVARRHTAGCCYSGPVASLSVHIATI